MQDLPLSFRRAQIPGVFVTLLCLGTVLGCARKSMKRCAQILGKKNVCSFFELLEAVDIMSDCIVILIDFTFPVLFPPVLLEYFELVHHPEHYMLL